ncbi:MAG: hypothetical protein HONDAALG_03589 [Gammaproteobacteria bacterium]|nr:hypothetical protein [Gammaproteobacteria bacterium]
MNRIMRWIAWALLCVALPVSGQRDTSVFKGKPWERIEQQRDDIESTILSGDVGSGYVLSASHLFEWKNTPAFQDIVTSVYRGYGGIPLAEEEQLLSFLKSELKTNSQGVGWLECGLLAMAMMKPEEAVPAFKQAAQDSICCQAPLTYALLGQALTYTGNISEATRAFQAAVKAASKEQVIQFQMRSLFADTMHNQGKLAEWQNAVEECCNSTYPLECAWGLQQEAQNAWYQKDRLGFETFTNLALAQMSVYGASPTWQWSWEKGRWNRTTRHLGYAEAALKGSTDAQMILDYECAALDSNRVDLESAMRWIEKWPSRYDLREIDQWDEVRQLWVQRVYVGYYLFLSRMGRVDEGVAGIEAMIPFARDTKHEKFTTTIYCHLGYALMQGERLKEAKEAYEIGLSLLDVPGEMIDPALAYHPKGRIDKLDRVMFVANYRDLLNYFNQMEGEQ